MTEYLDRVRRLRAHIESATKQLDLAEQQLQHAEGTVDEDATKALGDLRELFDDAVTKLGEAGAAAESFEDDFQDA